MKILILRFSSIGDIVLTTPVIRTVKTQLDKAEVHYATKVQYKALFEANPYVDKMHYLGESMRELIFELNQERFDYVIDLHHNLRTLRIKRALGVPAFSYNKLNIEKWLMVNLKINKLPNLHLVDRYMKTVESLGVHMDALGLDYFIPEKDEVPAEWLPDGFRDEFVVYAIGAQHGTKRLPVEKMIELCDRINKPVLLLGGPEDAERAEEVSRFFSRAGETEERSDALRRLNKKTIVYSGCGKFNLNQSASLVKQARYVFTHDTGLMHIAAAFKREIFSLWGNTIPAFGMYPYRTKFTVLENNRISCRPCSKIGFEKCPKGHFKCMKEMTLDFYLP
ncbi:MAG: glycosyltransferase family 9 protein [Cyclobacteriaceae bacterium]|nr:glycosyltransferase family 9 protein [Cyclobacteriaceae bacterium]